jgi:hypothetical protein
VHDWFAHRRFGYGAGQPISWQGWAITLAFMVLAIGSAVVFGNRRLILFAILVPFTVVFAIIAARTTRGGWRWRWGADE